MVAAVNLPLICAALTHRFLAITLVVNRVLLVILVTQSLPFTSC